MKQFLPFSQDTEIFRWGPIPGRYFYVSEFEDVIFQECQKVYEGFRWPDTLFLFKEKQMVWINDFNELRKTGREIFIKYMLPESTRKKLKEEWLVEVKELGRYEKMLGEKFSTDFTDEELYSLWHKFYELISDFWLPTIPCELGNYGSAELLEEKLKKIIKDSTELSAAMEILTSPEELSFYQQEEIDLSRTKDIEKHAGKYFWLRNSYNGTEKLSAGYFKQRKEKLDKDIKLLMEERVNGVKNKKKFIIKKYRLSKEITDISEALCDAISWQDERKKHIFIYLHYKELFLKEVARRAKYNIEELRNCSTSEVMTLLKKVGLHIVLKQRGKMFGFFMNPYKKEIIGEDAKFYWENYSEEKISEKMIEVTGVVASAGKEKIVTGQVKIIFDPFKADDFTEGNILVAPMTSPEYVFLMKKAKAVITDSGGLTSHAAIVSRELNIPCIVGTKSATKIFNDGDWVGVDTTRGLIRKIDAQ